MTDLAPTALEALKRNSRRAALVSLVGGVVVLAALGVSAWQVIDLQGQRRVLDKDVAALQLTKKGLLDEIAVLEDRNRLAKAQLDRNEVDAAKETLALPPPPIVTPAAVAAEKARVSVPRVYFQLANARQADRFKACLEPLRKAGYRVPAYEVVRKAPSRAEVRYFHAGEREQAEALRAAAQQCLGAPIALTLLDRYAGVNPLHFEIWLAP